MENIDISELNNFNNKNIFEMIGKDWMLITAGDEQKFNTMTASWGGLGVLWNKNVSFCFVRPQRYTFEFLEQNSYYNLSFYNNNYKNSLKICGTKSGKNCDKIKESGLNIFYYNYNNIKIPCFKEAKLTLICEKIYSQFINPEYIPENILKNNYQNHDYHKMYIGEIKECLVQD